MFITSLKVHAYLDPHSGSILIQLLLGGLLGTILLVIKRFWSRITAFFKGNKQIQEEEIHKEVNKK